MNTKYIIGLGEALWDMLPQGKKIGGAPANFAFHASQFGLPTKVVSAVGNDTLGDELISAFQKKHLNLNISRVDYPTGTVQVTLDAQGIPCYEICQNVAWDHITFNEELEQLAYNTRAVCFGSLAQRSNESRKAIYQFIDTMPSGKGQYKVFDINLRQQFYSRELIKESMKRANVLKINDEELTIVSQLFGYEWSEDCLKNICEEFIVRFKLDILILTCGTRGSYVFTNDACSFCKTPQIKVADTVGAGDSFTGSFVAALIHGLSISEAHQLAVDVSAFVCQNEGAMPSLPNQLIERVKQEEL